MQHTARYRGPGSRTVQTSACDHTEFVLEVDTLGYVKPVELSMHQLPQTAVELSCTTDYTRAAEFNTRCDLLVMIFEAPAKTTLQ